MNIIPQKCLLYNNVAFPLKDFPEDVSPQSGDKCLFIRDKNFCVPVYSFLAQSSLIEGLLAYWPFDEDTDATVAVDEMGRFNLTRMSSNNFGGCVGKMGGCWGRTASAFTGLAASEMISADEYQTGFTFNGWYKLQSGKSRGWTQLIGISKNANGDGENGGSLGIHLGYGESRLHFSASSDRSPLEDQSVMVYPITNPTDRWIMVTGVYDKSTNTAKVYLDGVLQNESVLDVQQPSGYLTVLGNDWDNVGSVLVDEFGFWNKPLTEADIASLYNNGAGLALKYLIRGEAIPPVVTNPIPQEGLVFFAPLTDRSTTTPSGHTLTYKNETNPSPVVKNGINGLWFDGISNDRDIFIATSKIAALSDWSISFWELIDSSKNDYTIFTLVTDTSKYLMCLTDNSLYNGSQHLGFSGVPRPPANTVGHIVLTHSAGTFKIYVNGEYISSLEETPKWDQAKDLYFYLGERALGSTNTIGYSFCGMLSHFRIYNRVISESEIKALSEEFSINEEI